MADTAVKDGKAGVAVRTVRAGIADTVVKNGMVLDRRYLIDSRKPLMINVTGPVALRKSGLVFPQSMALPLWVRIGEELRSISDSSAWWLADWLIYGETAYSGRYREVVERTGLDYQTLRNYAWVARRFGLARRRDNLSFAHHAEVASLEQSEQDYWLRRAEELGWSRNQLRKQVRASLAERRGDALPDAGDSGKDASAAGIRLAKAIQVLLPPEQLERCERAAMSHGLSLNQWVADVLRSAVSNYETSDIVQCAGAA